MITAAHTAMVIFVSCFVIMANNGCAAASLSVQTVDALRIGVGKDGAVEAVTIDGHRLRTARQLPFSVVEVMPPNGSRKDWGAVPGVATDDPGRVRFNGRHDQAALTLNADVTAGTNGAFIDITGEIGDLTGRDRALRLTFTLPVMLDNWEWENTAFRSETIIGANVYPRDETDVMYVDRVGARPGRDPMASGLPVNKLPYTAMIGDHVAFALACPTHEPRIFLTRAGKQGISITFTLGLSASTIHHPSSATFRVIIYRIDPAWGIRSAAARYRSFFPELFASTNRRHGNHVTLRTFAPDNPTPWPEHAEDFGFLFGEHDFQRTDGEMRPKAAAEAQRLGLIVFHWRGPWYYFHAVDRGTTRQAQLALLKAQAEGRAPGAHGKNNQLCGCPYDISAKGAFNSYLVDEQNRLDRAHYPKGYDCFLMAMNMNPDLPKPNRASLAFDWQYRFIRRWDDPAFRGPRNFAWDALDDWGGFRRLNFRREHFQYERVPLVFDEATGRLCILNGFTHWAFARRHAAMVHEKGGLVMCNANLEQALLFCAPYIDVQVKERPAERWDDERLSVERMLAGTKPITFIGGLQPPGGLEFRATLRKLLLFGIAPGADGEEGQRAELKKYMPVLRTVAAAGWEPVTYARGEGLRIERFGTTPGALYFAVANRGNRALEGRIRIDREALNLPRDIDAMHVTEILEARELAVTASRQALELGLHLDAGETLVVAINTN